MTLDIFEKNIFRLILTRQNFNKVIVEKVVVIYNLYKFQNKIIIKSLHSSFVRFLFFYLWKCYKRSEIPPNTKPFQFDVLTCNIWLFLCSMIFIQVYIKLSKKPV